MSLIFWILSLLQAAAPTASISGFVMNVGGVLPQPLQNARLELSGPGGVRLARTDAEGHFAFARLSAGRYRVQVTRDGFIRQSSPAIVVTRGQAVNDVVFKLQPAPTIYGTILDGSYEASGQPKANALVQALRMGYGPRGGRTLTAIASTLTDDRGRYRLYWLDPGEYKIGVQDSGRKETPVLTAIVPTYYSGVANMDEAQRIRLKAGREMDIGEFRLNPPTLTPLRVTGSVVSAITGQGLPVVSTVTLAAAGTVDNKFQFKGQTIYNSCTRLFEGPCPPSPTIQGFLISGVPDGLYVAAAQAASGERGVAYADARRYVEPGPRGRIVEDVRILVAPPINVSGKAGAERNASVDLTDAEVTLTSIEPVIPSPAPVHIKPDGTFTVPNMQTGAYLVHISGLLEDWYMKSAHVGKTDILENMLAVRYGSSDPLELVLAADGGQLIGAIIDGDGRRVPGVDIVLIPDPKFRHRVDQYRTDTSDRNGGFNIRGIPPGDYKLFAWENLEPNAFLNADFMRDYEAQGLPIRVISGRNASIQARVISAGP
jgi:hypothetical protein